jgi:O-acetyl-ADP-ribose deacetylase (regulator of RNase III)
MEGQCCLDFSLPSSQAQQSDQLKLQSRTLLAVDSEVLSSVLGLSLTAKDTVWLAACCHATRSEVMLSAGSVAAWAKRAAADFGPKAKEVVARVQKASVDGLLLYCACERLFCSCVEHLESVWGSVTAQSKGFDCVACPVLTTLKNAGSGAQGAIRFAAGDDLEEFIDDYLDEHADLEPAQVLMAPGGLLVTAVALTVAYPTDSLLRDNLFNFLLDLHRNLISATRDAGHRSLAMPKMDTGSMGYPASMVCRALVQTIVEDFCEHPTDPLLVRVCCCENSHFRAMNAACLVVKEILFQHLDAMAL